MTQNGRPENIALIGKFLRDGQLLALIQQEQKRQKESTLQKQARQSWQLNTCNGVKSN